jgi:hypothetical protein
VSKEGGGRQEAALDAREDLRQFLGELRDLLHGCLTERSELFGRGEADLGRAWVTVLPRFADVDRALEAKDAKGESLSAARVTRLNRELEEHGLTGEELALKLNLFRRLLVDFLDELVRQDEAEGFWDAWVTRFRGSSWLERFLASRFAQRVQSLRKAGRRMARGSVKLALDAADVVLGSLGQALSFLPGVGAALGGIGEFKDATIVALGRARRRREAAAPSASAGPEPERSGVPARPAAPEVLSPLVSSARVPPRVSR